MGARGASAGGALLVLVACNPDPGEIDEQVGYRDGIDGGATSGERGTVRVSEVLWSGTVRDDGTYDPADIFIELRNESARPVNLSGWLLTLRGTIPAQHRLPESDLSIPVGEHVIVAAKADGCLVAPEFVLPELRLPNGDPFAITLMDRDERLIDGMGNEDMWPFAGGYDTVRSRSMERVELMFGGESFLPMAWHFYTPAPVDVPNNDRVAEGCRARTLASPGRPNSPDYSGATASGDLE